MSQGKAADKQFFLSGTIVGRDTGQLFFWYNEADNQVRTDTLTLKHGKFFFSGTVNKVCEALLWTNIRNLDYDDASVVHFLLQPGTVRFVYDVTNPRHPQVINGPVQVEKERWDQQKGPLLTEKINVYQRLLSSKDTRVDDSLYSRRDSLNRIIWAMDRDYIRLHTHSFLSSYLLWQQRRRIPVDSLQRLYSGLSMEVRKSTIGINVLQDLYALTNDTHFRKENPLEGETFDQRLNKISSVHDLALPDSNGQLVHLSDFRGKWLVLDFWASWCAPCRENIPALNQLVAHYRSASVQFVSISLDQNAGKWKGALIHDHPAGVQLCDTASFNGLAAIYCKALFVYTYIIADPSGKIVRYQAPPALDPGLKQIVDSLLNH
jgi:thiol-disulfide isomerase/thioredoxin